MGIASHQLKGSVRGALICAFFGSAWMYWAVAFSGYPSPLRFSIVTVTAIALVAWVILRVRAMRHRLSSAIELEHRIDLRTFFWVDFGIESVLAGVGAFALARLGRFDLIPQALGVIIGLHFIPLGKIFHAPHYYWTGGIMLGAALGSLFIHHGYIRNVVECGAIGLTLWGTAIAILFWKSSAVSDQTGRT